MKREITREEIYLTIEQRPEIYDLMKAVLDLPEDIKEEFIALAIKILERKRNKPQ